MTEREKLIEAMAIALCRSLRPDLDPNVDDSTTGQPSWKLYITEARAALAALVALSTHTAPGEEKTK